MATVTSATLPPPVQESFNKKLIAREIPNMIHQVPAVRRTMPRNGGKTMRMRRYNPLPSALAPLGDTGVHPPAVDVTALDIDATIQFYGQYIVVNEQVTLTAQDPVLNEFTSLLGVSLRKTEDELTRDMLVSGAGFINCANGGNGDNPTEIAREDVNIVTRTLLSNDAHTILDNIEGSPNYGSSPVRDSFFAMCSTELTSDLDVVPTFVSKNNYGSDPQGLPSEWGTIGNVRFLISSIGSVTKNASALNAHVYNIPTVGMEAYTVIEQDGYSTKFVYIPPVFSGPLALNSSVGWKMAFAAAITNDAWIVNLRATLIP